MYPECQSALIDLCPQRYRQQSFHGIPDAHKKVMLSGKARQNQCFCMQTVAISVKLTDSPE